MDSPPYAPQKIYHVDDYQCCPENWMRSSSEISSYFVGIKSGHGMWLDFNDNNHLDHYVAILISVQGINPITGLKHSEAKLERYEDKCLKHGCKFGKDRYCEECGYQWPMQNYLSSLSTRYGSLWLDGFRTTNGEIRQYIFTEEEIRGVAKNIIGNDRVFSIGISFFKSKNKKNDFSTFNWPNVEKSYNKENKHFFKKMIEEKDIVYYNDSYSKTKFTCGISGQSYTSYASKNIMRSAISASSNDNLSSKISCDSKESLNYISSPIQTKNVEIGAGAKINQKIYDCEKDLDFWEDEPSAQICINYTDIDSVEKILSMGKIDFNKNKDGFLSGIPIGN